MSPGAWSDTELELIVRDYLDMLRAEREGRPYSKTEHRNALRPLLNRRSDGSIERKHMNISACMIELGYPYIDGYKPYSNYQRKLKEVVAETVLQVPELHETIKQEQQKEELSIPSVDDFLRMLTNPPKPRGPSRNTGVASSGMTWKTNQTNYLEQEARNQRIGRAGEKFILNFEQARLIHEEREDLAGKIEHVADQDDSAGFDILSFESSGKERFIEVKTTRYGEYTPFFISTNEVQFCENHADGFHLYRVYKFERDTKLFMLKGDIREHCDLQPTTFRASFA